MKVEPTLVYDLCHEGMKHDSMRGIHSWYSEWYEDDLLEGETYLVEESESDGKRSGVADVNVQNLILNYMPMYLE